MTTRPENGEGGRDEFAGARQLAGAAPAAKPDVTEQIAKLAALRDQGALTEDELVQEPCRSLDVREQERHRPSRETGACHRP